MRSPKLQMTALIVVVLVLIMPASLLAQYDISTVAGGGPNNLGALKSSIGYPGSFALDAAGNSYIADSFSSRILKVSTAGVVTVVAGNSAFGYSGDGGPATSATLNRPEAVAVDASGNIFIADTDNSVIREVVASTGNIQTVAGSATFGAGYSGDGGQATSAQLDDPYGVFVDASGNIFIADTDNFVIREVAASSGKIQTIAGNNIAGPGYSGAGAAATSAQLDFPEAVFVDASGNIFIADTDNNVIRAVNPGTTSTTVAGVVIPPGDIETVVGAYYQSEGGTACAYTGDGGPALSAQLCVPAGVFVDASENILIADTNNSVIREVAAPGLNIATVAGDGTIGYSGDGAAATSAELNYPNNIFVDGSGNIFVADTDNFVIREVAGGDIQTVIGNNTLAYSGDGGSALNAELDYPGGVFVNGSENIFIADSFSSVVREVVATSGDIQTVAGNGTDCASAMAACGDGGPATSAQFFSPDGVFVDASGNVFIADTEDNRIRVVNTTGASITIAGVVIAPGDVETVAGTGQQGYTGDGGAATSAALFSPSSIFVDSAENIFIADTDNHRIREVVASTGIINTVAGNGTQCPAPATSPCGDGGAAIGAELNLPAGVVLDSSENIYIADTEDNRVRVVNTSLQAVTVAGIVIQPGDIATVAGTGAEGYAGDGAAATSALLASPNGLFVDSSGDIFIADTDNFVIREVVSSTGFIATIAGNNTQGFSGDGEQSTSGQLNLPLGVYGDANANVFIADTDSSRIRELIPTVVAPTATQPAPQTTSPGGSATFAIELNKNTGNPKYPITLSCLQSSLPSNATCSFSPSTITPGPLAVPFTLTITVPSGTASVQRPSGMRQQFMLACAFVPLAGLLFAGAGFGNKRRCYLLLAVLGISLILLNACGGSGGSTSGSGGTTYNVQVQGATSAQPNPVTITTAELIVQ